MTIFKQTLFSLLLLALVQCIENPIYTNKDIIELPQVIGEWNVSFEGAESQNEEPTWTISQEEDKSYLIDSKQGHTGYFIARFTKLNKVIFADVVDQMTYRASPEQVVHNIYKIETGKNKFTATPLDEDYLDKALKAGKYDLPYRIDKDNSSDYNIGEMVMITANTKELQAFLVKHHDDELLFPSQGKMVFTKK